MVNCLRTVFGLLLLQICISAAPNNATAVEEPISKAEEPLAVAELKENEEVIPKEQNLDSQPLLIAPEEEESKLDDKSSQSMRQKRFYNFYGASYGGPTFNPVGYPSYPSYNKRDQSADTGVYGFVEDPLEHIQKRLQDIASYVRQPLPPPPPPSHFPFFLPVIYVPQYGCDCSDNDYTTPPQQPETPQTPRPEINQTDPNPDKRFPELNDERQNWGLVTNESDPEYDEDEFSRPISFDAIQPNRPLMRPIPPVDHGSSQGNINAPQPSTTARPNRRQSPPPFQGQPTSQSRPPSSGRPGQSAPYPPSFVNSIPQNGQPSKCDGAVLTCCHQSRVSYDCFVAQGCPNPTSSRNLCDPSVILQVIEKYQRFYGVRNG